MYRSLRVAALLSLVALTCAPSVGQSLAAADQEARLLAPTPTAGAALGFGVDIDGDLAVLGGNGPVFVFTRTGASWTLDAQIDPPADFSSSGVRSFGGKVSLDGTRLAIAANSENGSRGVVVIYTRSPTASGGDRWTEQARLAASDAVSNGGFGAALDLNGDRLVAGSSRGKAYIFEYDGTQWAETALLTSPSSEANSAFGQRVAIEGDQAVVGAYTADIGSTADQGAVYTYLRNSSGWQLETTLTASDGTEDALFGSAVDLDGGRLLIGAQRDVNNNASRAGAAYVFERPTTERTGGSWVETAKMTAESDRTAGAFFGTSVALSGDVAVIGANGASVPNGSGGNFLGVGAVYVFAFNGTTWTRTARVTPGADTAGDLQFGTTVGTDGDRLITGAPFYDDPSAQNSGIGYVFGNLLATSSDPGSPLASALSAPAPNPVSGTATLRLRLDRPASVRATLHDALGRTVRTLHDGAASGTLDLRVETAGLAAGAYLIRVSDGASVATRRLTVVR